MQVTGAAARGRRTLVTSDAAAARGRCTIVTALTVAALLVAGGGWTVAAGQGSASPFAACEPAAGERWTYDDLMCLRQAGITHDARDEVVGRLRAMGAGKNAPWPTLVLALVRLDQLRLAEAVTLYELAAAGFALSREAEGEVIARQNLAKQYRLRGDIDLAARHVARAVAAAEASGDSLIVARAGVIEAAHSMATGGDIGRAHRVLLHADSLLSSAAPIGLRRTVLFNLANASLYLGHIDAAVDALERHRALRAEDGSPQNAAAVEFNLLIARLMANERRPRRGAREQLVAEAEAILLDAANLNDPLVAAQAHQVLGDLLARQDVGRAADHLQRCLDVEATLGFPSLRAACLWSLSRAESDRDPPRAQELSDRALSLLDADHDRLLLAYAWQSRLRLIWRSTPQDTAVAQSYRALDAIERLRSSEGVESTRAGLFGNWARDYQWLTGQLLRMQQPRLAQAFDVGERLRSRVLLERVTLTSAQGAGARDADATSRDLGARIAATQRELLSPAVSEGKRHALTGQLRLLELERENLNDGRAPPVPAAVPTVSSLEAVQRMLDEQEVMVWFSIAPWKDVYDEFGGGSWAVTIQRDSVTVHRLSASDDLEPQVAALVGLVRDRRTSRHVWSSAARMLGEDLFGDALTRVPSTITRLVIVTDGALHRMPFELLTLPSGSMLGERFAITEVPSATLWMRMRESGTVAVGNRVLVLADPELRGNSLDGVRLLERLPGARREAHAISRALGPVPHQVAEGAAASERFVKIAPLESIGILHLAAHARADAAYPDRSAVFLAPGDAAEDGWLQPGEIAALDLRGRLVVLSACDSAEGALLPGEGPMSLARAFFSAGARAVVATRWPLRDDDAAFVIEHFYRGLAEGRTVDAALREARRTALVAGLPAAAWAGITVLGDGGQQPLALWPLRRASPRWMYAVMIVAVIAIVRAAKMHSMSRSRDASGRR